MGEEKVARDGGKSGGCRRAFGGCRDCDDRDEGKHGGFVTGDNDNTLGHPSDFEGAWRM